MRKIKLSKNRIIVIFTVAMLMAVLMNPMSLFCAQVYGQTEENSDDKCGLQPIEVIEVASLDEDGFLNSVNESEISKKFSGADEVYWKKFSSQFYYEQMPNNLKRMWNQLEQECILAAESDENCSYVGISSSNSLSRQEIVNFICMFKYSNPQYYFLSNRMFVRYDDEKTTVGIYLYEDFTNGVTRKNATDLFFGKINNWLAQIQTCRYDEEKVKLAHDLVAQNTVYGYSTFDQSAYSMVCEGVTVCAGYAASFQMLLNASGIEAAEVTSDSHGWNIVRLHGYWYNVDVTWDDSDYIMYRYYNKGDVTFRTGTTMHNPEAMWQGLLPEMNYDSSVGIYAYQPVYINDNEYNYFIINDNPQIGNCMLKAVGVVGNGYNTIPETVLYNGKYYVVVNADAASQAVNGLYQGEDGEWHYYCHGIMHDSYTGMAENEYGWWYLTDGEIDWDYTGMACNEYGWWYYRNGQLDWNYTGMACNEYGWWYYRNGQLDWDYTGMACNEYGWWYYRNGQLDWDYTGMAENEYGWWYYRNGQLDWDYTGMAENEYGWWYYSGGKLDWTYTGWGENQYGLWYFNNGQIVYD